MGFLLQAVLNYHNLIDRVLSQTHSVSNTSFQKHMPPRPERWPKFAKRGRLGTCSKEPKNFSNLGKQ